MRRSFSISGDEKCGLVLTPFRLLDETNVREDIDDPSCLILPTDGASLTILIGEAGYGKTTTLMRACFAGEYPALFVPAAAIPSGVNSTVDLVRSFITLDEVFQSVPTDRALFEKLFATVLPAIFRRGDPPFVLFIDGLDESIYFSRRGGMQSLFNQLQDLRIPCVVTARTEYWTQKRLDFAASFGAAHNEATARRRYVNLVELRPWNEDQMAILLRRAEAATQDRRERDNLSQLIEAIARDGYDAWYGDIPRRPLFLRLIADTVSASGLHRTGRARLLYEWALAKVTRDVVRPMQWGGIGRQAIASDGEDLRTTIELSFLAMMLAADLMTAKEEGALVLLPTTEIQSVLRGSERLRELADPTGLFLNSLLVPVTSSLPHEPQRIRFSHRLFQEFFLALHQLTAEDRWPNAVLPTNVAGFLHDLEIEGLSSS